MTMILDLHVHSRYSVDSLSRPAAILRAAKAHGLTGVAITDHGTIAGGLEALRLNNDPNFQVIVGAEIRSEYGDINGLFLTREIKSRTWRDIVNEIHDQGGLAVLPHPYKWGKPHDKLVEAVDAIEVFNGRTGVAANQQALALAETVDKPMVMGSDAHFLREIGVCRMVASESDPRRAVLSPQPQLITRRNPAYLQRFTELIRLTRMQRYWKLPRAIAGVLALPFQVR